MITDNVKMVLPRIQLSQFLKSELSKKDISLSKLAKEINVPKTCLHSWENGVFPRLNEKNLIYLGRLSIYFNVSVLKILFGEVEIDSAIEVLFESTFKDGKNSYRFRIEKL